MNVIVVVDAGWLVVVDEDDDDDNVKHDDDFLWGYEMIVCSTTSLMKRHPLFC